MLTQRPQNNRRGSILISLKLLFESFQVGFWKNSSAQARDTARRGELVICSAQAWPTRSLCLGATVLLRRCQWRRTCRLATRTHSIQVGICTPIRPAVDPFLRPIGKPEYPHPSRQASVHLATKPRHAPNPRAPRWSEAIDSFGRSTTLPFHPGAPKPAPCHQETRPSHWHRFLWLCCPQARPVAHPTRSRRPITGLSHSIDRRR